MPTARELLEQADALMRRNRKRGKGRLGDVPTLTDALGVYRESTLAPTVILPHAETAADPIVLDTPPADSAAPADAVDADPISLDTLGDVPVLTDVVIPAAATVANEPAPASAGVADAGDAFPLSAADAEAAAAQLPPPAVLEQEAAQPSSPPDDAGEAVQTPAAAPLPGDDEFILEIPPATPQAAPVSPEPPIPSIPAPPASNRDWDALAEEIRMQVLQRLDLFTDTGMRDQLGARLSPIVDRASAQLIETINRELGELVRGYVAEAIEREIESWRTRSA
jgi:hypothetical protein